MERVKSNIPFVGLHAHSVAGSVFDGFGYPQDHMDFAYKNGMGALALTDHGNMNGMSYQVLHAKKMKAELEKSVILLGFPAGTDISVLFSGMSQTIESLKQSIDD